MHYSRGLALGAAFSLFFLSVHADVRLPAIFGDHTVLQEGAKLSVWGTADPGEKIIVSIDTDSAQATAGADGKWRLDLAPLAPKKNILSMTVSGKNTLTFSDVLVGDVWVCSGQTNIGFNLDGAPRHSGGASNAATAIPAA